MKIKDFENPQKALLVIDIQEDCTGTTAKPPFPYKTSEILIATVNKIIEVASKRNMIIVYIKHEFEGLLGRTISKVFCKGIAIKGNPGTEIDKRVIIMSDYIFSKSKPNAFSNLNLEAFLSNHQVNELYIVGLDAAFCVNATAKGALKKGYKVSIIKDGIALLKENRWDDLMKNYEQGGITLITSEEI